MSCEAWPTFSVISPSQNNEHVNMEKITVAIPAPVSGLTQ